MNKILIIILLSLLSLRQYAQSNNNHLDTFTLNLAIEYCPDYAPFSFCRDAYGQIYNLSRYLVELDTVNMLNSYNGKVFVIYDLKYFTHSDLKIKRSSLDVEDYLYAFSLKHGDTCSFYNKKFKRMVNKSYRKDKINRYFNGRLYYAKVKLTFVAKIAEPQYANQDNINSILLPNFNLSEGGKHGFFYFRNVDLYQIVDILEISRAEW